MKEIKLFIIGMLAIIAQFGLISCSGNDGLLLESPNSFDESKLEISSILNTRSSLISPDSYLVSFEDAKNISRSLYPNSDFKIEPYVIDRDTLLYLVNYKKGWVIIAGDKRINPIVAESDKGYISKWSSNENLMTWIDSYADEIHAIRTDSMEIENEYTKLWSIISPIKTKNSKQTRSSVEYKWAVVSNTYCDSETSSVLIPHLVSTKWGQGYPWNTKLPIDTSDSGNRCPTGCVAVALSQIVYYMHYHLSKPTALYHNISIGSTSISGKTQNIGFVRANLNSNSTRWNDMALHMYSTGNISYVGDLMLDMGNRLGMKYSGSGSSADISSSAMSYYNLSYSQSTFNYSLVKTDLLNSKPVNVTAYRKVDGSSNKKGHSWIIDGIGTKNRHYVTSKHFEYTENWMYESEYYDTFDELRTHYHINSEYDYIEEDAGYYTSEYLFVNWGYDGDNDNGYFSTYPSTPWTYNNRIYNYDKVINYDFR